ncbi:MAG: hypothetical protein IJ041_01800, partial [Clostridia bacterium]|nr:hypothetical protein [Clostridia bacterium]
MNLTVEPRGEYTGIDAAAGAQPTFRASTANLYQPVRQPTSTTSVLQDSIQQDPIQKAPSTNVVHPLTGLLLWFGF